jgi:hypothetical protein
MELFNLFRKFSSPPTTLSERDFVFVTETLKNPPPIDERLAKAFGVLQEQQPTPQLGKFKREIILDLLVSGNPLSVDEMAAQTGIKHCSVAAFAQDLRKAKYGGHNIKGERWPDGVFRYLYVAKQEEPE